MRSLCWSLLALFLFSIGILSLSERVLAGELHGGLAEYLEGVSGDELVSVIVHLRDQADVVGLDGVLKGERVTRRERHERVVRLLRETASRTQPVLLDYLSVGKLRGDVVGYTSYWISNLVVVQCTKSVVMDLVGRPDVGYVERNFEFGLIDPVESGGGGPVERGIGITPGLVAINANRVWHELGITGNGRLVATLDTGVDGNHPALSSRWRGVDPGVHWSEAWLDVVYGGSQFPADFYGHGTHVQGTMCGLGEATADTIGVAWRAKWIACNAIDQFAGPEFDNDVIEAFQWFADPDGDPFTVDDVPDVVQNSWGINEGFGGSPPYTDCDSRWWAVIDNCEAAGVVVTISAGNEGPGSQSLRSPADRATTPYNAFSVGAVDATNYGYPYPIAGFSSRGPSGCGGPYEVKPEVCAPGVDVYSSVPGGGYQGGWSGTSMAGPHAAGVVALMREANPNLTVDEIKFVLMQTAHDFGTPGEDNTYGMGHVDAYEAVLMVMSGVAYLVGTVTDIETGEPVPADLELLGTGRTATADPVTGAYSFIIPGDSTYTVEVSYFGYDTEQQAIYVAPDDTTRLDFQLTPSASGNLAGMVMDFDSGLPIGGATVEVLDTPIEPATTSSRGIFNFGDVPAGNTFTIQTNAAGYGSNSEDKTITVGELSLIALPLESGFSDDIEAGINGWTHTNVTPGYIDQWHQSVQRNHTAAGTTSWKCGSTGGGNYADLVDAGLVTPEIDLQENSKLLFWHWMDAEIDTPTEAWDGGIVEISINGGAYQQITPVGGYPYTIVNNPDSPFPGGTPCFSGTHDWKQEEFDLSGFSGSAKIRFRFGTDGFVTEEGWFIDDVIVAPDTPTQSVSIMLLPTESVIEIGPAGGSFTYHMALVNNTRKIQTFDWWIDVSIGQTVVFGPIEAHTDSLEAGETMIVTDIVQEVPPGTRPRTFNYNGKVGTLPDTVDAISSFQFTVTGMSAVTEESGEWTIRRPRD
jgi:bacillopeptidase F